MVTQWKETSEEWALQMTPSVHLLRIGQETFELKAFKQDVDITHCYAVQENKDRSGTADFVKVRKRCNKIFIFLSFV